MSPETAKATKMSAMLLLKAMINGTTEEHLHYSAGTCKGGLTLYESLPDEYKDDLELDTCYNLARIVEYVVSNTAEEPKSRNLILALDHYRSLDTSGYTLPDDTPSLSMTMAIHAVLAHYQYVSIPILCMCVVSNHF